MRNPFRSTCLLAITLILSMSGARAEIAERFDAGAAGWSAVDLATGINGNSAYTSVGTPTVLSYLATGGNPGGYIQAADPSDQSFIFQASSAFLGDLSGYMAGSLSFDTYYTPTDNSWRGDPDVILSNGATTLFYQGTANPGATWTHVNVNLAPGVGWSVGSFGGVAASATDFADVLASVSLLRIRGEYYAGVAETTGLDNVVLSAVPEPSVWIMSMAGLVAMRWRLRHR